MSNFASSDQSTRQTATQKILQEYSTSPEALSTLNQEDYQGIVKNLSNTNSKFQQLSIQLALAIYEDLSMQTAEFQDLVLQEFNLNLMLSAAMQNMKSGRAAIRQDLIQLGSLLIKTHNNLDAVCREAETLLRGTKNIGQRQSICQMMSQCVEQFGAAQLQKLKAMALECQQDSSADVKKAATELLGRVEGAEASVKDRPKTAPEGKTLEKSQVFSGTKAKAVPPKSAKPKDGASLFPAPEDKDEDAQNAPFSIVPPQPQQSFYPYRPGYGYTLLEPEQILKQDKDAKELWAALLADDKAGTLKALQAYLTKLQPKLENNAEWMEQQTAIQKVFQLMLLENQQNNPELSAVFAERLAEFFSLPVTSQIIQSQRSTLSREVLMCIEFIVQRYGPLMWGAMNTLVDGLISMLSKKGVYFECLASSLLKSLIVHSGFSAMKQIYARLCAAVRVAKVPSARCYLIDLLLLCLIVGKLYNGLDGQFLTQLTDIIPSATNDANPRVRQTGRVFVNTVLQFWPQCGQQLAQKIQNQKELSQGPAFQAGYARHGEPALWRVDEPWMAAFFLQAASCHQGIRPAYVADLPLWRFKMITDDGFQLEYEELGRIAQATVDLDEYLQAVPNLLAKYTSEETESQASWHSQPQTHGKQSAPQSARASAATSVPSTMEKRPLTGAVGKPQQKQIQPFGEAFTKTAVKEKAPETVEQFVNPTTRKIQPEDDFDQFDFVPQIQKAINRTEPARRTPPSKQQPASELGASGALMGASQDDDVYDDVINAMENKKTAVNLRAQLVDRAISLQPVQESLVQLEELMDSDSLSEEQKKTLLANLLNEVSYQDEETALKMLGLLLKLMIFQEKIPDAWISSAVPALVDLFNCEFLAVRRKADEILRALIGPSRPEHLFQIYRQIIQRSLGNAQKIININGSLRLITYVVRQMESREKLLQMLPDFIPLVVEQFNSQDVNLRKTAVSCFIDFFMVIGQDFQDYVDALGDYQLKLVIERMKQIQAKRKTQ